MKNKVIIKQTLIEIFKKAFLPNAILVPIFILLQWAIVALWVYYHPDKKNDWVIYILALLTGSFTFISFILWGLRRIIVRSYLAIHNNIIVLYLPPFSRLIAKQILESKLEEELLKLKRSMLRQWQEYILEKTEKLPSIIQSIIRIVLRKFGYSNLLDYHLELLSNKDINQIETIIHEEIASRLIYASNRIIPRYINYLIPLNIIAILLLWILW